MSTLLAVTKSLLSIQKSALSQANLELEKLEIEIKKLMSEKNYLEDERISTIISMLLSNERYWHGIKSNAETVIDYIKDEVEQAERDEIEYLASMEELYRGSNRPIPIQI